MRKSVQTGLFLGAIFLSGTILLTGCGDSSGRSYIEAQGSDTMVNMGQSLAEYYMEEVNQESSISVSGGGSGTGISAIINDDVDIAQSSRAMTQEEIEDAQSRGVEVFEFIVAQDGIAVVVNDENPIEKLSFDELKEIFTGKIQDWSNLGWEDGGNISIYSRQSSSGTYVFFNENVMDGEDFYEDGHFMPGTSAIADSVETDRDSIGYVGVGYVREGIKPLKISSEEGSTYVTPLEAEKVNTGEYPLARPLYFYTNGAPEGEVQEYLEWILSNEGQKIVQEAGFYQITPEHEKINQDIFQEAEASQNY